MHQLELFERWVPILDGCYYISNIGRIRSVDRIVENHGFHSKYLSKGKLMNDFNNGNGYRYVTTSINGIRKNHYIHKLVAKAFIPNPNNFTEVNHIDGVKSNNNINNLEWCNRSINSRHAYKIGANSTRGMKVNARTVVNITTKEIFKCIKDASDFYKIKYGLLKESLSDKRLMSIRKNPIYAQLYPLDYLIKTNHPFLKEIGISKSRLEE